MAVDEIITQIAVGVGTAGLAAFGGYVLALLRTRKHIDARIAAVKNQATEDLERQKTSILSDVRKKLGDHDSRVQLYLDSAAKELLGIKGDIERVERDATQNAQEQEQLWRSVERTLGRIEGSLQNTLPPSQATLGARRK